MLLSRRTRVLVMGAGAGALIAAFVLAWEYWPPLLNYRADRTLAAARATVARYLAGNDSLNTAARRLAVVMQRWERLIERTEAPPPLDPGSLRAETIAITPEGVSENDPRVEELVLNALRFSSAAFSPHLTEQLDSLILARGHRIAR